MIKVIYNSPAMPQGDYNFALDRVYECEKIKDKYVIKTKENKEYSLDFLKSIFKPCDGCSWEMLEEVEEKENKTSKANAKSKK